MRALGLATVVICLAIFVSPHADGSKGLNCNEIFPEGSPIGLLSETTRSSTGSTGGRWQRDKNGIDWFVKKDVHYPELQTSAEVIASNVYRHFGYNTPLTLKFIKNGVHFSASRDVGKSLRSTDFSTLDNPEIRQLRIVAAFLKDWDRLGNPANNLVMPDGSVLLLDFGGTLGSRAQGRHKPGTIVSNAIGSFENSTDLSKIYDSFSVNASSMHPWNNLIRSDIEAVVLKFRALTNEKIESIVNEARYSSASDAQYMVDALKTRRDTIIDQLPLRFLPNQAGAGGAPVEFPRYHPPKSKGRWLPVLTRFLERDAVKQLLNYQAHSRQVNHFLRFFPFVNEIGGTYSAPTEAAVKTTIQSLDRLMDYFIVSAGTVLFRGEARPSNTQLPKVGDSYTEQGFMSTSRNRNRALEFAEPSNAHRRIREDGVVSVLHVVRVTEPVHGIDVPSLLRGDFRNENEVLLQRNLTLKVTSAEWTTINGQAVYVIESSPLTPH